MSKMFGDFGDKLNELALKMLDDFGTLQDLCEANDLTAQDVLVILIERGLIDLEVAPVDIIRDDE